MKTIKLKNYSNKTNIVKKIVFIDGVTRSGKLLTGSLISSFQKMESLVFGENFEHFMPALKLKKCSYDFARSYLNNYINQTIYNKMISRDVNFRPRDITSIRNFFKPILYKKRLTKPEGDVVLKKIKLLNPILPFVTHDIMMNYNIFKKLNIKVKLIEIYRNPFELTHSWFERNLANNLENSKRSFTLKIMNRKKEYPWYLKDLPKNWDKFNDHEKCAYYVILNTTESIKKQKKIKDKKFLYTTTYTHITENTHSELKKIARFLGTNFSNKTKEIIRKKNCPNFSFRKLIKKKKKYLKQKLSNKIYQKLLKLESDYNKNIYGLKKY